MQDRKRAVGILPGDDGGHADAHVEGVEHFAFGDVCRFGDEIKDRQHAHGAALNFGAHALRQAARDVFKEAAARDVRHGLDRDLLQEREHGLDVDFRRREQRLAEGRTAERLDRRAQVGVLHVEHAAHEGEAVGMYTARRESEDHVARSDGGIVQNFVPVHDADGEAREIVFVHGVEARHLGGLAADERGAGLHAALRHAGDDGSDALRDVLAAGNVVEEEQGLCAAADDVVDAHGDTVDADGVVLVHLKRELQLGADAVRAGDEHRLCDAGQVEGKQPAESADAAEHAVVRGTGNVLLHQLHSAVSGGDVHPGGCVTVTVTVHCAFSPHLS